MDSIWKQVAANWRMTIDDAPSASIEDLTDEALELIEIEGLIGQSQDDFDDDDDDDDDDWP
ncbi:hypothetical protein [Rossellomorea aquimaris]|uniref:hypothetical protein n=1 Tax=Rossellomorea aquimaris TaxID=189382 RepID=UPI0007D05CAF|nr:hypothetical protein [Rossellomorea aquimaris]